jgi:hypothetical protein
VHHGVHAEVPVTPPPPQRRGLKTGGGCRHGALGVVTRTRAVLTCHLQDTSPLRAHRGVRATGRACAAVPPWGLGSGVGGWGATAGISPWAALLTPNPAGGPVARSSGIAVGRMGGVYLPAASCQLLPAAASCQLPAAALALFLAFMAHLYAFGRSWRNTVWKTHTG